MNSSLLRHEVALMPNSLWLGKKKRVTLIAALRCEAGAVIICADSQETAGAYRVSVDKIAPKQAGNYDLVIGGAGNVGGLIDDFSENFTREVESWPSDLAEQDIRNKIRKTLLKYHAEEIEHFPAAHDDKRLQFVICIKQSGFGDSYLWRTDGTALVTVTDYTLLGFDEAIYQHEIKKFYYPQIPMTHVVMLFINLFVLARDTSNYIGGRTQLITVRKGGVSLAKPDHVRDLEERAEKFNMALKKLVLACPDLSVRSGDFDRMLRTFEEEVVELREHYFQLAANEVLAGDQTIGMPHLSTDPYPILPGGMLVRGSDGRAKIIPHEQVEDYLRTQREKELD